MQLKICQQDVIMNYQRDYIDIFIFKRGDKKSGKLFGGIVANTDLRKYKGRWVYFNKPSKKLKNNFNNWGRSDFREKS